MPEDSGVNEITITKRQPVVPYDQYKFKSGSPTRKSDLRTSSVSPTRKSRSPMKKTPKSDLSSRYSSPKRAKSPIKTIKKGVNPYGAPSEQFIQNKEEILTLLKENQYKRQETIGKINQEI